MRLFKNNQGQSLVELLIAGAVGLAITTAFIGDTAKQFQFTQNLSKKTIANSYATQLVEIFRSMTYDELKNYLSKNPNTGSTTDLYTLCMNINYQDPITGIAHPDSIANLSAEDAASLDSNYVNRSYQIQVANVKTLQLRTIGVCDYNIKDVTLTSDESYLIIVKVGWGKGRNTEIILSSLLPNINRTIASPPTCLDTPLTFVVPLLMDVSNSRSGSEINTEITGGQTFTDQFWQLIQAHPTVSVYMKVILWTGSDVDDVKTPPKGIIYESPTWVKLSDLTSVNSIKSDIAKASQSHLGTEYNVPLKEIIKQYKQFDTTIGMSITGPVRKYVIDMTDGSYKGDGKYPNDEKSSQDSISTLASSGVTNIGMGFGASSDDAGFAFFKSLFGSNYYRATSNADFLNIWNGVFTSMTQCTAPTTATHVIFATSYTYAADLATGYPDGNQHWHHLNGVTRGDLICQGIADLKAQKDPSFAGIWKAVLSSPTKNGVNAKDHIVLEGDVFNTHGELVAHAIGANSLFSGPLLNAVKYDENGKELPNSSGDLYTGTSNSGTYAPASSKESNACDGSNDGYTSPDPSWTDSSSGRNVVVGNSHRVDALLSESSSGCDQQRHILCISQKCHGNLNINDGWGDVFTFVNIASGTIIVNGNDPNAKIAGRVLFDPDTELKICQMASYTSLLSARATEMKDGESHFDSPDNNTLSYWDKSGQKWVTVPANNTTPKNTYLSSVVCGCN